MWIARDKNNKLYLYTNEKPFKGEDGEWHITGFYNMVFELPNTLFPEVKWEDKEPRELVLKPIKEE